MAASTLERRSQRQYFGFLALMVTTALAGCSTVSSTTQQFDATSLAESEAKLSGVIADTPVFDSLADVADILVNLED